MNGFFLVDKPVGFTSFDVCARLKKKLNEKRIGHTGTLDPFASGLLVIATGRYTRLIPFLEKNQKTYHLKVLLGKTSETLDPESEILSVKIPDDFSWEIGFLKKKLEDNFIGKILQVPPKFSALKINGKRAYDLARKGETFEMKQRETEVFSAEIVSVSPKTQEIEMRITVAAGFYVRSFARDFAMQLGTKGVCNYLRREKVGSLCVSHSQNLADDLQKVSAETIVPLPKIEVVPEYKQNFCHGMEIFGEFVPKPQQTLWQSQEKKFFVGDADALWGVADFSARGIRPRILLV